MPPASSTRRVIVLGSTGSIGTQTLQVIAHLNALADDAIRHGREAVRFQVVGLAAGNNANLVFEQARHFGVRDIALAKADGASAHDDGSLRLLTGLNAAEQLVRNVDCDIVVAAVVGAAGLPATLAAVSLGRDVALANKETLVAAGELVIPAARSSGSRLLPVDSEHSGLWQCLFEEGMRDRGIVGSGGEARGRVCPPMACSSAVSRVVLTASGGPFRSLSLAECYNATPEQALKHPTWSMGAKVTIDSASLTNKAFEIIEAHWLFGLSAERIGAIIHPQSVIHAMVEMADGSVIAQLGSPDMRMPIQLALTFPSRPEGVSRKLDLLNLANLEFQPVDTARFPAVDLAYRVIRTGGRSGAVFNAASEEAVGAFLARSVAFGRMPELAREAMDELGDAPVKSLADVMAADAEARRFVRRRLAVGAVLSAPAQGVRAAP